MKIKPALSPKAESGLAIGLIILATALTYGVLIPQLGFYRDDWYMLWAGQARGTQGIIALFEGDRPFLGWIYALDYAILGASPLGWHVYALLLKILGNLAFFWLLRLLWPEKRTATTFATLIFALYPGYFQQPNAATFKNLLLAYDAAIASLALTVLAFRTSAINRKVLFTTIALILAGVYLFIYESLLGIEAVRLALAAYMLRRNETNQNWQKTAWLTIRRLWPYFLLAGGFAFWRLFLFQSVRRAVSVGVIFGHYGQSPVYSLLNIQLEFAKDLFEIVVAAWFVPLYQFTADGRLKDLLSGLGLTVVICGAVAAYWWLTKEPDNPACEPLSDWLWLGSFAIFITTLPIVAAGRNVIFALQWDRYSYQAILGVALLLAGTTYTLLKGSARQIFLISIMALAVMTQYHSAAFYRDFWAYEQQTWQQLAWRAPDLADGTNIVAVLPQGFRLAEEYEIWGPVNYIYRPGEHLTISGQVLDDNLYYNLIRGSNETRQMRNITVQRDFARTLVISLPGSGSCLHVIDGLRPELSTFADAQVVQIASYSKITQIVTDAEPHIVPTIVFGSENRQSWCYYYQKISLARQRADWEEAVRLADEAQSLGLKPANPVEWMPVFEAYANAGRVKEASEIAKKIKSDANLRIGLCQMIQAAEWPAGYQVELIQTTLCNRK